MNSGNHTVPGAKWLLKLLVLISFIAFAYQGYAGTQDVIYMKDGSIYRGTIISQVAGVSYTIQVYGGYTYVLAAGDVKRITQESSPSPRKLSNDTLPHRRTRPAYTNYYEYEEKGIFGQIQTAVGLIDGMRATLGYKINRYAALGVTGGFEYGNTVSQAPYAASNGYFPLLLTFTGDCLKRRVTPWYSVEAGYNFVLNKLLWDPSYDGYYYSPPSSYVSYGGVTSGVGVGLRRYSVTRYSWILSAHINLGYLRIQTTSYTPSSTGPTLITSSSTANWLAVQPSLRFAFCFQ
jgi:hypothetical protein